MLGDHQSAAPKIHYKRKVMMLIACTDCFVVNLTTHPRDGADDSIPDTTPVRDSMSCDS